jgi:hypothetical protein
MFEFFFMTAFSGTEGAEGEERGVLMSDVVASVITTSSQDGQDDEARVNIKRRRKGMIKSASS